MALTRPLKGLSTRSITPSPSFPSVTVGRPRLCSGNCQREVGCCQAAELHGVSALLVRVSAHRLVFQQRSWCCTDGPAPPAFLAPTGSAVTMGLSARHQIGPHLLLVHSPLRLLPRGPLLRHLPPRLGALSSRDPVLQPPGRGPSARGHPPVLLRRDTVHAGHRLHHRSTRAGAQLLARRPEGCHAPDLRPHRRHGQHAGLQPQSAVILQYLIALFTATKAGVDVQPRAGVGPSWLGVRAP